MNVFEKDKSGNFSIYLEGDSKLRYEAIINDSTEAKGNMSTSWIVIADHLDTISREVYDIPLPVQHVVHVDPFNPANYDEAIDLDFDFEFNYNGAVQRAGAQEDEGF